MHLHWIGYRQFSVGFVNLMNKRKIALLNLFYGQLVHENTKKKN